MTLLETEFEDWVSWRNSDWTGGAISLEEAAGEWSQASVVYLTRQDAEAYFEWLGEGRLPTIAELATALVEAQATGVHFEAATGYELVNDHAGPWGACVYSNAIPTCLKLVREGATASDLRKLRVNSVQDSHILPDRTISREGLTAILTGTLKNQEADSQPAGFRIVR
jgi:formylglycine-generating enzyme required for sulfatase activity